MPSPPYYLTFSLVIIQNQSNKVKGYKQHWKHEKNDKKNRHPAFPQSYQLSVQEYNDIAGGYSTKPGFNDLLFRNITALYLNLESSGIERNITDFLFHYFHEVGMLDFNNGLAYYEEPNLDAFTKEMKESLVEIARHIIGEEINLCITLIRWVLRGKWIICYVLYIFRFST